MAAGDVIWRPGPDVLSTTVTGRFLDFVGERDGVELGDYRSAHRWSVEHPDLFWSAVAEFGGVDFFSPPDRILTDEPMPATRWFPGARLNYSANVLKGDEDAVVLVARSETRERLEFTRGELRHRVMSFAAGLERLGVRAGDRVAAYLPNSVEAIVGLLACGWIGATWTALGLESGPEAVIARFNQVSPKVLLATDGYRFRGKDIRRVDEVAEIARAIASIESVVCLRYLGVDGVPDHWVDWAEVDRAELVRTNPEPMQFEDPLYILYTSGTTGPPKAIVHGHGGILLEHLRWLHIQENIVGSDRFYWNSSIGWLAWNIAVSSLLCGSSLLIFDGAFDHPDLTSYWRMIAEERVSYLGTSPVVIRSSELAGIDLRSIGDFSTVHTVTMGGSPAPAAAFEWIMASTSPEVFVTSSSGGTDVASSFVGGTRLLPVRSGEISCIYLGCPVDAFDEDGHPVVGQRGELVLTGPMPSMPVQLWGDTDGSRFRSTYFSRFDGIWNHGDWITIGEDDSVIVHGRSDATLNRGGVRLGASEFYDVAESIDGVTDSLVLHLEDDDGGQGLLVMFLVRRPDVDFEELRGQVVSTLRAKLSPRHVPDVILEVSSVPRNVSGKKLEIPVKRVLRGVAIEEAAGAAGRALTPVFEEYDNAFRNWQAQNGTRNAAKA
ncbi:acetoacetate--CoA ligase [Salinibacterium sp. ZJ454]|uniref:acetoacetate--CoA ligase n=1 Tax=Salinibacterium sp. ZJ454 TaxID=2708339 RepID=UPI001AB02701|nr:acetoacetate--CoA ligase [Salinibacterium sp. ZJ454]